MRDTGNAAALRRWSREHRLAGRRIGFVPTMGFLHTGHAALMHEARRHADAVVVSVFVNPKQFGPQEDLARYPRDLERDRAVCEAAGVDLLFVPDLAEIYPPGFCTTVEVQGLTSGLCGRDRPTHFRGVTTVVARLFGMVEPDVAVFGEKDYQQLAVIRRMVRDLSMPVEVVGVPIVREADGLALSSRNVYLAPDERARATSLSRALALVEAAFRGGERDPLALSALARGRIESEPPVGIDYVEVVDAEDLAPLHGPVSRPAVLALAARYGRTRLIDNRVLDPL